MYDGAVFRIPIEEMAVNREVSLRVRDDSRAWCSLTWNDPTFWPETDYTGRWMISITNGEPKLYIEIFDLEEVDKKVPSVYTSKPYTRGMLWWKVDGVVDTFKSTTTVKRIRANVRWADEESLAVIITETEEFINECSGSCLE